MKNSFIIFFSILLLAACSEKEERSSVTLFDPEGKSYIRVINQTSDSVEAAKFYSTLLGSQTPDQWSTKIPPSGDTVLVIDTYLCQTYTISLQRSYVKTFLNPGDTTIIRVTAINRAFDDQRFKYYNSGDDNADFIFEGKFAAENQYLKEKDKLFEGRFKSTLANNPTVSLSEYAFKIDSLANGEKAFLDSMNRSGDYHKVFFDVESASIYYSALSNKLRHPSFLSFQLKEVPEIPENYYDFIDDVDLNIPGRAYNHDYYSLLGGLAYYKTNEYWEQRIKGFSHKMRKTQDSLIFAYLSEKHSNNDFDPLRRDSLVSADKISINLKHFSSLSGQISPELFDLLIYNQANMHAIFGTVTQSMISKVVFEKMFRGNKYLDLINYKKGLQKGDSAPYFYLKNQDGSFSELKDYVGKIVYINFWAPWCKPCMAELPAEKALAKNISNDPVEILNICVHCDEKTWKKTIKEKDMPGAQLFAQDTWTEKLTASYQNIGIPHYTLIDREGRIIANPTYRPSDPQLLEFIRSNLPDYGLLK